MKLVFQLIVGDTLRVLLARNISLALIFLSILFIV